MDGIKTKVAVCFAAALLPVCAVADDKLDHAAAGAVIGAVITNTTNKPWLGFAAGCLAGLAKEEYDKRNNGKSDSKDIVATCLGATISFAWRF